MGYRVCNTAHPTFVGGPAVSTHPKNEPSNVVDVEENKRTARAQHGDRSAEPVAGGLRWRRVRHACRHLHDRNDCTRVCVQPRGAPAAVAGAHPRVKSHRADSGARSDANTHPGAHPHANSGARSNAHPGT